MKCFRSWSQLREAAVEAFAEQVLDKVEYVSHYTTPDRVKDKLDELNQILEAGCGVGVTSVKKFEEQELKEIALHLKPMRTLNMRKETMEELIAALREKGMEDAVIKKLEAKIPS